MVRSTFRVLCLMVVAAGLGVAMRSTAQEPRANLAATESSAAAMTAGLAHLMPEKAAFVAYADLATLCRGLDESKLLHQFGKRTSDILLLISEATPLRRLDAEALRDFWIAVDPETDEGLIVLRLQGDFKLVDLFDEGKTTAGSYKEFNYVSFDLSEREVMQVTELAPQVYAFTVWSRYTTGWDAAAGAMTRTEKQGPPAIEVLIDRQLAGQPRELDPALVRGMKETAGLGWSMTFCKRGLDAMGEQMPFGALEAFSLGASVGNSVALRIVAWTADEQGALIASDKVAEGLAEIRTNLVQAQQQPQAAPLAAKGLKLLDGVKSELAGRKVSVSADWTAAQLGELIAAIPPEVKQMIESRLGGGSPAAPAPQPFDRR